MRINLHRIVRDLNLICKQLDDDYDVNCGGCCYIAYLISKHLDKLHLKYKLCVLNCFQKSEKEICKEVQQRITNREESKSVSGFNTCNHYYILLHGGGAINFGDFEGEYFLHKIDNINHNHIKWIYDSGLWNDRYDTDNNKLIKKKIKRYFQQYE